MKKRKGFTLVELVLVIVVAGIAIPAVIYTFNEVSRKSIYDEAMTTATMLAEGELERVVEKDFNDIQSESNISFGANFAGYSGQIIVSAVPVDLATDPDMAQYKQVESRVTSNIIGDVSLKTIVTNN